ncbi:squalene--hopene cyclase [Paenibacillus ferrarius]|uniref:Squalene--hopene cyclase n=1 Tax=Paenibacillus ferrarius TaxID=1469647 RepID=A0A1V4HN20_9BACL|nr:squalene--hopene cyclase [Paenibacillus ferrarius]OPH59071.1 squalene--hopene cyclase [Paenibacillus ferrarius]
MPVWTQVNEEIHRMTEMLSGMQRDDGSWRFCFENGILTDAYLIIVLRTLELPHEELIQQLHARIIGKQEKNGAWKVYADEEDGNLDTTVYAYYALLFTGYSSKTDESMEKAAQFIRSKGGLGQVKNLLTQAFLAATGQSPWPATLRIPLEFLLLPTSSPISFFDFSNYARIHFVPILLMVSLKSPLRTKATPDLSNLYNNDYTGSPSRHHPVKENKETIPELYRLFDEIHNGIKHLASLPGQLHKQAVKYAEQYMLEHIEPNGTLFSYASSTLLMMMALAMLGYDKHHPVMTAALRGLLSMMWYSDADKITEAHLQNSPSTIWDTALLSYALQQAGTPPEHAVVRQSIHYLRDRQHTKKGDWSIHAPSTVPGGWGFSESNTINPDVDDTTAALRAIHGTMLREPACQDAWNRGLNWVLSMQNKDGGWPAFEKGITNKLLAKLPVDGASAAAIDPSTADLTGRTLEFLGATAGLDMRHRFIRRGTEWLLENQEADGSWFGRWGICYIYGTWSALTGLMAVKADPEQPAVRKAVDWLLSIQNDDGGWGESCSSDSLERYVPLGASTPSQTAWALDALTAVHPKPLPAMERGLGQLLHQLHKDDWTTRYPTGAGLPGSFYTHYHSYRHIWPLIALTQYKKKYETL